MRAKYKIRSFSILVDFFPQWDRDFSFGMLDGPQSILFIVFSSGHIGMLDGPRSILFGFVFFLKKIHVTSFNFHEVISLNFHESSFFLSEL
jgi:hypothetical protein